MDCIVHGVAESDTTERLSLSLSVEVAPLPQLLDMFMGLFYMY